jgi:hypothetical protein
MVLRGIALLHSVRIVLLLLLSTAVLFAQLDGIVDIHTHADPDSTPRKIDVLELARLAKAEHMRGVVLKNHYAPTVQVAYLLREVVPGIELFGAIALNRSVGGVNPEAVAQSAAFKGKYLRIVWMPTIDAENNVRGLKENRPSVPVSRNGKLLPEVIDVLKIIAKENIALATGHSTPAEDLMLVEEARRQGITKIVVTHPLYFTVAMSVDQMKQAAQMGAYLEFCANSVLPTAPETNRIPFEDYVKAIRAVGVDHTILSSDLGQPANPVHTEGWKIYLAMLRKAGFTESEIDAMAKHNPAHLVGLE